MLHIRYTATAPLELDISGSVQVLQSVSDRIRDFVRSDSIHLSLAADVQYDPAPYEIVLSRLLITKGIGLIRVIVEDESLVHISGDPTTLIGLAEWFSFSPHAQSKTHAHFEYYDDHPLIASHSIPLVIMVE